MLSGDEGGAAGRSVAARDLCPPPTARPGDRVAGAYADGAAAPALEAAPAAADAATGAAAAAPAAGAGAGNGALPEDTAAKFKPGVMFKLNS